MEENLTFVWNIAKTAIGIGFVVFVHELGHFLLAKWNGVKVERFSIGFGRTLVSYRRGVGLRVGTGSRPPGPGDPPTYSETEYVLAALPLGGYVKMLGESLEDQTEKAEKSDDPRAFNQKSVFARMQIITAGVIMNLILGVICFALVYTQGATDARAKVGGVIAGGPAYKAGLMPGDEIVAIDDRREVGFKELLQKVAYSGAGQKVKFTIKRPGSEAEQALMIEPLRDKGNPAPTIGIVSTSSLDLMKKIPFQALPGQTTDSAKPSGGFEGGDHVIAIGPEGGPLEPVADYYEFNRKAERLKDKPIVVEVERKKTSKDGTVETSTAKVTVPVHNFVEFGFQLTPGPILAFRPNSPGEKAGLKVGDRILAIEVDGHKVVDPMRFPDESRASAGKPIKLTVERPGEGKTTSTIEVTVTPDDAPAWSDPIGYKAPLDIPGLGLAMAIEPKIQAVVEGSPAAKAGLKPGNVLKSVIFTRKKLAEEKSEPWPITSELGDANSAWPVIFGQIQQVPAKSIEVTVEGISKPIAITPEVDRARFHPIRGLDFEALRRKLPPQGVTESLIRGAEETFENVVNIFSMFRNLSQGRVGSNAVGGILPIAQVAYDQASAGWIPLIHFLGILSVNLAVLNFLPIPPLDGGQFLFLTAEKVRGKPLPEWMLNFLMIGGVVFVLGLILLVNGKDVWMLVKSYL